MIEVREYAQADIPAVTALIRGNLGVPGYDQRYFRWKFDYSAGDRKARGFVAGDGGRVIGFASFFPCRARVGGKPGFVYLVSDCVIDHRHRGKGHFGRLFGHALERVEGEPGTFGTYLFSSADSDAIYKGRYGYRPIRRPEYYINIGDWRSPLARKLRFIKFSKGPIKEEEAAERRDGPFTLNEEMGFDGSYDRLWERVADHWPVAVARTSGYLEWRFLGHPWHSYRILTCRDRARQLLGYVVLRVDSIYDFVFADARCGAALLGFARAVCARSGVPVVNCFSLGSDVEKKALAGAGFVKYHLPFRPFGLYSRPKPLVRPSASLPGGGRLLEPGAWKFTYADVDCGV